MNCDDAFDLLTCTDLTAGSNEHVALEAHLAVCPECRRLAVALRPAVDLMLEAWDDDLPASEQAPAPWVEAQHQPPKQRPAVLPGLAWTGSVGLSSAVLLGVIVGIVAMAPAMRSAPVAPSRRVLLQSEMAELSLLGISDACLVRTVAAAKSSATVEAQCCTGCHADGREQAPQVAVDTLTASCHVCHNP